MANLLNIFRSDIGKLRGQLHETRKELEGARRRREDLLTLPLPPDDVADLLCQLVERSAAQYPMRIRQKYEFLLRKPLMEVGSPGLQQFHPLLPAEGLNIPMAPDLEAAICFMFLPQVKDGIRRAVTAMGYVHGPKKSERVAELAKIETRIAELEASEKEMLTELEALRSELNS